MDKVREAIIGAGLLGRKRSKNIRYKISNAELAAVCSPGKLSAHHPNRQRLARGVSASKQGRGHGGKKVHTARKDFFELVKKGTLNQVRKAIVAGVDLKATGVDGESPLMAAAQHNQNSAVISVLLKAGADLKARDKVGMTPLMYAAMNNKNPEVVTTLLKAGADTTLRIITALPR